MRTNGFNVEEEEIFGAAFKIFGHSVVRFGFGQVLSLMVRYCHL
jgi:hypothetical protein